ncbi:aminotransferase class I/II-fold pyridoxal phosphate-dependent enzyme [Chitinimonas arctica]|uniref:Putative 8-amino-7-oxononanoate synthase n=1 Tax=Chitinimonas arctica TaxID=2594795 RepID=A0A516SCT8_9NEIS|nr:aminotransferase class I/II-fold pyridoxal phosphate-dependent enzyme [Chitinimonas arctica]QDQ25967.1 aminotransferase class I/II-fold pyridoxal phosphate-dependent enzyme [Chitinimonas arctica]
MNEQAIASRSDKEELILSVVRTHTRYAAEDLVATALLQEELGIDSIMIATIGADLNKLFQVPQTIGIQGVETLAMLIERFSPYALRSDAAQVLARLQAEEGQGEMPVDAYAIGRAVVLDVVRQHTQYALADLPPEALLQEELGVDSIMLAYIVGDLNKLFSLPATVDAEGLETLGCLIERFSRHPLLDGASDRLSVAEAADVVADKVPVAEEQVDFDKLTMRDFVGDSSRDLFAKVDRFAPFLRDRTDKGLFWYGMPFRSACTNRAVIFDEFSGMEREFLMFASNNYLGLANDPRVIEAIVDATQRYGATNTGCRLIGGTNTLHLELEAKLAAFKGREACIVFPSGYSANVGVISALLGGNDTVISDVYNHMSIQDGCKLSGAARRIYQHNDMASLETALQKADARSGGKLIVADGVFSMHGDIARLPQMVELARQYGARLLIDDAHATGVLGKRGSGTAEHFGLCHEVDLEVGTMSKALAGMGGFVVGDREVIDYLRFYANSYVFAATIPAGVAAGLIRSVELMEQEPERLAKLWANIRYLRSALQAAGFNTEHSESAVIPIVIGDEQKTMAMGRSVRQRGLFCQTVVFPGVAVGDARLRISVLSTHTQEDLDQAIAIFTESAHENQLLAKH